MRTLVAFLLGLIIGGLTMMYLPDQRRGELNKQLNQQIETLQSQVRELGDQLKHVALPKPSETPSTSASPKE
jgi:uncharacterized membrane-anchored protein YhcB (DUF1043 family)